MHFYTFRNDTTTKNRELVYMYEKDEMTPGDLMAKMQSSKHDEQKMEEALLSSEER